MKSSGEAIVQLRGLEMIYGQRRRIFGRGTGQVHAVDGVSLEIRQGETLGLVGESGCGKSTLARCVVRLEEPTGGQILFDGEDITHLRSGSLRSFRRKMQLVFQDPFASLNPRKRIGATLEAALQIHGIGGDAAGRKSRVLELLGHVGLSEEAAERLPSELSGGQRQRVGIARALSVGPRLIVADEPVSALDVSVQAGILNLLKSLQAELGLTMLFISHDLGVVRHVSDRVGVMYLGKLVEIGPADPFYRAPLHPYSLALLSAVPLPDPDARDESRQIVLEGDVPSAKSPPSGCRFHTRCPYAQDKCRKIEPQLADHGDGRFAACHFPLDRAATVGPS
ncbi:MAG TPA: oligopeptide/dipeptide ABC transporter ATP-binding protein [Devosiaceae bacterium]